MPYIPHTEAELGEMLKVIGANSLDDLFADIAPDMRPKSFDLPAGRSEDDTCAYFEDLAAKNRTALTSFLGAGYYNHNIPKAVDALSGQSAFYTAYTPYQAECSQGTLQAIFEYETAISRLLDMDIANASVYDGGSAIFEAAAMSCRLTHREKVVIDGCVNPLWRAMLATYSTNLPMEIVTVPQKNGTSDMEALRAAVGDDTACVVVQNPNFFGVVSDFSELFAHAKSHKAMSVISVYPIMQAVVKTPGEMGADVAVGEGQSLGMPLSFGGPYLGFMATTAALTRKLPGRIVGETTDAQGRRAYVLSLQAREQHIRREKASSNICSNEALCALTAGLYMATMGPDGMAQAAEQSMAKAHYLADALCAVDGVKLRYSGDFFHEFVTDMPKTEEVLSALSEAGILGGLPVDGGILWCATEKVTKDAMDKTVAIVKEVLAK